MPNNKKYSFLYYTKEGENKEEERKNFLFYKQLKFREALNSNRCHFYSISSDSLEEVREKLGNFLALQVPDRDINKSLLETSVSSNIDAWFVEYQEIESGISQEKHIEVFKSMHYTQPKWECLPYLVLNIKNKTLAVPVYGLLLEENRRLKESEALVEGLLKENSDLGEKNQRLLEENTALKEKINELAALTDGLLPKVSNLLPENAQLREVADKSKTLIQNLMSSNQRLSEQIMELKQASGSGSVIFNKCQFIPSAPPASDIPSTSSYSPK